MPDEYDALLGDEEPVRQPRIPRPPRDPLASGISLQAAMGGKSLDDLDGGVKALLRPVTKTMLATVFRMDADTINRRLARCPSTTVGKRKLYDFAEAASYIVKPKMTPQEFIRTLNTADMPPQINKFFWDAQRTRIRYKLEAQEAWDTADVLEVLSDVFMTVKDVLQMATEEVRERARLTDEQAELFEQFIDDLRQTLREKLIAMPEAKRTPSMMNDGLFGTSKNVPIDGEEYAGIDDLEDDE